MNDKPSVFLKALGAAGFITCLCGLVVAINWPDQLWLIPFVFALCFTLVLSQPAEIVYETRERWNLHLLEIAELRERRKTVAGAAPVAGNGAGVVVEHQNPLQAAWVRYWIDAIRYSQEVGGLTYRQMADYFKNGKQWETDMITPLIFAGYVTPRSATNPNAATTWAGEWDADKVVWRLEAGVGIPPLPPYGPQTKFPKQDTGNTSHNTVKTGETEITR